MIEKDIFPSLFHYIYIHWRFIPRRMLNSNFCSLILKHFHDWWLLTFIIITPLLVMNTNYMARVQVDRIAKVVFGTGWMIN